MVSYSNRWWVPPRRERRSIWGVCSHCHKPIIVESTTDKEYKVALGCSCMRTQETGSIEQAIVEWEKLVKEEADKRLFGGSVVCPICNEKPIRQCRIAEEKKKYYIHCACTSSEGFSSYEEAFYRDWETDRKSTRLNSSHITRSRMPSSA